MKALACDTTRSDKGKSQNGRILEPQGIPEALESMETCGPPAYNYCGSPAYCVWKCWHAILPDFTMAKTAEYHVTGAPEARLPANSPGLRPMVC